jgi:uncharacterized protein
MQIKSIFKNDNPGIITNIDASANLVEGYFSVFGNVDSDNDMVMPGAFTKTLQENGSRIRHLWQHDPRYPIARPELTQDSIGLKFRSKLSNTTIGKDTILLYEDGVIDEHSFGYQTIRSQSKSNYNELIELKVWEGSSVTWGANPLSLGGPAGKAMTKDEIINRMDTVYKALRHGKYETEDIFILLDIQFEQLKSAIKEFTTPAAHEAPEPETVTVKEAHLSQEQIKSLINIFK